MPVTGGRGGVRVPGGGAARCPAPALLRDLLRKDFRGLQLAPVSTSDPQPGPSQPAVIRGPPSYGEMGKKKARGAPVAPRTPLSLGDPAAPWGPHSTLGTPGCHRGTAGLGQGCQLGAQLGDLGGGTRAGGRHGGGAVGACWGALHVLWCTDQGCQELCPANPAANTEDGHTDTGGTRGGTFSTALRAGVRGARPRGSRAHIQSQSPGQPRSSAGAGGGHRGVGGKVLAPVHTSELGGADADGGVDGNAPGWERGEGMAGGESGLGEPPRERCHHPAMSPPNPPGASQALPHQRQRR